MSAPVSPLGPEHALVAPWVSFRRPLGYRLAVLLVAVALVALPLVYAAMIAGIGWGVWWHLSTNTAMLGVGRGRGGLFMMALYLVPVVVGGGMILFLLKPMLAPRARREMTFTIEPVEEPRLYAFVERLCEVVGAPPPRRIDVDCDVNASASFRSGLLSFFLPGDLVLTIGMSLVAGMNTRQFAGVLAHEFGHFAQGGGMRASYLIRTITMWFARAAWERDGWDASLEAASRRGNIYWRAVAGLMRVGVGLSRLMIKAMAWLAHFLAGYMSRQMEYDADSYQVRFAGSAAFESMARRLMELSAAYSLAEEEAVEHWKHRKLPDSLPALVDDAASRLPAETRDHIERELTESRTGLFDSHPSLAARIARARRAGEEGVYRLEAPAAALFSDFAGACRKASYGHYQQRLGQWLYEATFVPTEEILAPRRLDSARRGRVGAFLGCEPPLSRPFFPPIRELSAPEDPPKTIERLVRARAKVESGAPAAHEKAAAFRAVSERLVKLEQASSIFEAGVRVLPKEMKLASLGRRGVGEAISRATSEAADAAAVIDEVLEASGVRLAAALRLLCVKGIDKRLADAEARRRRAGQLLRAMGVLKDQAPRVESVRRDFARASALIGVMQSPRTFEDAKKKLRPLAERLRGTLLEIRRDAGGTPSPYPGASGESNLGERLIGDTPGQGEFGDIMATADRCLTRYADEQGRALAELIDLALTVEDLLPRKAAARPARA